MNNQMTIRQKGLGPMRERDLNFKRAMSVRYTCVTGRPYEEKVLKNRGIIITLSNPNLQAPNNIVVFL